MINLYDYQKQQVLDGLEGSNLNLSEVGTGKTFVGLSIFKQLQGYNKLLIICLASKVDDFVEDGAKVGLSITALNKSSKKSNQVVKDNNNEPLQCYSVSFESSWRVEALKGWVDSNTMILIDESHKVKSRESKVTYNAIELAQKAGYTYLMTATPITNGNYEDWFSQLVIAGIHPNDWKTFQSHYCITELNSIKVKGQTRYFNEITGYKNIDILEKTINKHAVSKKRELSADMEPIFIDYYVTKPTMYNKLAKQRVLELDNGTIKEYDSTSSIYHAQRQLASGGLGGIGKLIKKDKIERVKDILTSCEDERVTIFYNYNSDLHHLKELLEKLDRPYSCYNGSDHDLTNFKEQYNGVALVQYKSGATGKNDFVISSVGIFYSQPDGSTTYIQACGRLNRIGQTKQPVFYNLICKDSVESRVRDAINQGIDITEGMQSQFID